jgi:hypothetical protein
MFLLVRRQTEGSLVTVLFGEQARIVSVSGGCLHWGRDVGQDARCLLLSLWWGSGTIGLMREGMVVAM